MRRKLILLFALLLVTIQAEAFTKADLIGEWEFLGRNGHNQIDVASATGGTPHVMVFTDRKEPRLLYRKKSAELEKKWDGNYGHVVTNGHVKLGFYHTGEWTLSNNKLVIHKRRIDGIIPPDTDTYDVTYLEDEDVLALKGPGYGFSYYKKLPQSSYMGLSPYYSGVQDAPVSKIEVSVFRLGMAPKTVISNLSEKFIVTDKVHYADNAPYVEEIRAVQTDMNRSDSFTFKFAKPPHANILLSIKRGQKFFVNKNSEFLPPTMKEVSVALVNKYGKHKSAYESQYGGGDGLVAVHISWMDKPKNCSDLIYSGPRSMSMNNVCPALLDAVISVWATDHDEYPGLVHSISVDLINYPDIVTNEKAAHLRKVEFDELKIKEKREKFLDGKKSMDVDI